MNSNASPSTITMIQCAVCHTFQQSPPAPQVPEGWQLLQGTFPNGRVKMVPVCDRCITTAVEQPANEEEQDA